MIYETQEQLDAALAEWQKILRLQDWNITISLKRVWDMPDGLAGRVTSHSDTKEADIQLLAAVDYSPHLIGSEHDHEDTIVHELLHLYFIPLAVSEELKKTEEQAICMVADALVRLKRDIQHPVTENIENGRY